jgi:hypothetical protein
VIEELKDFWPLTLRQIHYQLLNDPPLRHASKPDSRYRNDESSYKALVDAGVRGRHEGRIPYEVIDDPTRPSTYAPGFQNVRDFLDWEIRSLFTGYSRNLMQSQTDHVVIALEKLTLHSLFTPVALEFCVPLYVGRGMASTPMMHRIAKGYLRSGKRKLIVLAVSDLDPDGDAITHSLGKVLRWDFDIETVEVKKVGLTMQQVNALSLPRSYERAKVGSMHYRRYVAKHDTDAVWELEAVEPLTLRQMLIDALNEVINRRAYGAEAKQERADKARVKEMREQVLDLLREQVDLES